MKIYANDEAIEMPGYRYEPNRFGRDSRDSGPYDAELGNEQNV
jgi:hypothetical protein